MTMTTDFDLTKSRRDQGSLTFEKSEKPEKYNRFIRISNVWVYLTCKIKIERLLKSVLIYLSEKLRRHNEHLQEQYDTCEIKQHLHQHIQQYVKCDNYLHRYMKYRRCLTYTVWFVSLLIIFFLLPSKVSALNDQHVIAKAWSRIETVSSTHSFLSELSSGNPIVTKEYFNPPLVKDMNRLVDRSEDIIKIQDEEESRTIQQNVKPIKDAFKGLFIYNFSIFFSTYTDNIFHF